jgi:hypothetical protein
LQLVYLRLVYHVLENNEHYGKLASPKKSRKVKQLGEKYYSFTNSTIRKNTRKLLRVPHRPGSSIILKASVK